MPLTNVLYWSEMVCKMFDTKITAGKLEHLSHTLQCVIQHNKLLHNMTRFFQIFFLNRT